MKTHLSNTTFLKTAVDSVYQQTPLDKSLQRFLLFLQDFIPIQRISLHYYDLAKGVIHNYAEALEDRSIWMDSQLVVPPTMRTFFEELDAWSKAIGDGSIFIMSVDDFVKDTVEMGAGPILSDMRLGNTSGAIMDLVVDDTEIGFVLVAAKEGYKITDDHLRLLNSLNDLLATMLNIDLQLRLLKKGHLQPYAFPGIGRKRFGSIIGTGIVGADRGLKSVMDKVQLVAQMNTTVLLTGETGTGKEMIANAIVLGSTRSHAPYIKVNCAAIPSTLLEGELFGHEKGAFTGAISLKRGYFERAERGTIFLDEIGELTQNAQLRLLRVVQEKEFERIGGQGSIPLNIRVIAATHRNLEQLVLDGKFREDLYFRLKVFPIEIPPLRNRPSDIEPLVRYFVKAKASEMKFAFTPTIAAGELEKLTDYDWPGNVRELENMIERALILCQNKPLVFDNLNKRPSQIDPVYPDPKPESMDLSAVISIHIQKVLHQCDGKIEGNHGAAQLLNLNPSTLRTRMKKLDIPFGRKVIR